MTTRIVAPALLLSLACLASGCALPPDQPAQQGMNVDNRLHLAAVAERSGADGFALSMYQEAATKSPASVEAQYRYAHALADGGHLDEAASVLGQALKTCGPDPMLLAERGRLELFNGQPAGALADFQGVLDKQPSNIRALTDRGIALDMLGRHPEAEASYREALKSAPEDVALQNNLALSLLLEGRAKEAVDILQPLAQRPDADDRTRDNLAVAMTAAGGGPTAHVAGSEALSRAELVAFAAAVNRARSAE